MSTEHKQSLHSSNNRGGGKLIAGNRLVSLSRFQETLLVLLVRYI